MQRSSQIIAINNLHDMILASIATNVYIYGWYFFYFSQSLHARELKIIHYVIA